MINIDSHLTGEYNVYNILSAVGVAKLLGVDNKSIRNGIAKLKSVDGRFMVYSYSDNKKIIIDFAHTPDGFEKVLSLVKKLRKGKITCLFGCVGYSDSIKRRLMGEVASKYCDKIIITTDNIGNTNFDEVVEDISKGVPQEKLAHIIFDRPLAIKTAFEEMEKNETLVLLGKGTESKQVIGDKAIEYNEVGIVTSLLKGERVDVK